MSTAVPLQESLESNFSLGWFNPNHRPGTLPGLGTKPLVHIGPFKRATRAQLDTGHPELGVPLESNLQMVEKNPQPVVIPKPFTFTHNRFVPLQKWEGVVLKKTDQSFFARLVDLTTRGIEEEAEFALEEVPDSDLDLLQDGAVFYWDIGYLDQTNGQRLRASSLRFRRLPAWTAQELKEAENRASHLEALFAND